MKLREPVKRLARGSALGTAWTSAALSICASLAGCASAAPDCGCAQFPEHAGCRAPEVQTVRPPKVDYLLAEARLAATLGKPRNVEISNTPKYQEKRAALASAAIRLPDNCVNDSAARVTGEATQTDSIVNTSCGVWLSELEKALVHANFRVISWDALSGLERSARLPAYQAAKQLGADVLFLFNSLETSGVSAGAELAQRVEYFASDEKGGRGEPFPMSEGERAAIRGAVRSKMGASLQGTEGALALASTLDATAILTSSGESIWFYRNTSLKPLTDKVGQAFLFARYQGNWYLAERETERTPEVRTVQMSAVDEEHGSVQAGRDPYATQRLDLVRNVAQDFVSRFRDGTGGT